MKKFNRFLSFFRKSLFKEVREQKEIIKGRIELTKTNVDFPSIIFQGENNIFDTHNAENIAKIKCQIFGNNNRVFIKENVRINGSLNITIKGNDNDIEIGSNTVVNRSVNISIFTGCIGARGDNCKVIIGKNVFFNGHCFLLLGEKNTQITINDECLFASNITLATSDNHPIYDLHTKERLNIAGDIKIGKHCWICNDVKILNNSFINDESVIAANALVTSLSNPPPHCLIAGIPARVIKENIYWKKDLK